MVCLAADREAAVEHLRDLGTVHVVPSLPPASAQLDQRLRRREDTERVLGLLSTRTPQPADAATAPDPAATVGRALALAAEQSATEDQRQRLVRAAQALEPWGSFSRESVQACRAAGLQVVLAALPADALPTLPAGAVVQELSRAGKTVYVAVVAPVGLALALPEVALPEITDRAELNAGLQACAEKLAAIGLELDRLAAAVPALRQDLQTIDDDIAFARARDGMGCAEQLAYLEGYVPARDVDALLDRARRQGWAIRAVDPAADDLRVPTKLWLPRWAEPVRTVLGVLGILPGYREIDISACFLLFFSLFFAMLIGDAGYGVILLTLTLVMRLKFRQAPAAPFWLFGVLAVCTIVWGVLTGTYFAIQLPDGHPLRVIPSVSYLAEARNVQRLCFLIGVVHLTIAHLWNAAVTRPWLKAIGSLAWIPVLWGNYFLAKMMVLGDPRQPGLLWLYVTGLVGVLLFTEPSRNPLKMVGTGLGKMALNLTNSFVDVVSYVRLFAAGAAGVKVAESLNEMALGLRGVAPWVGPLLALLLLLLGHAFNMALGTMAVLVHGVRLNVMEFAGHIGLEFSGQAYRPLRRQRPAPGN